MEYLGIDDKDYLERGKTVRLPIAPVDFYNVQISNNCWYNIIAFNGTRHMVTKFYSQHRKAIFVVCEC